MFPFSRDAKDDPSANAPAAPAPAPAHPLDALTGGVFSAATSGERAQRLRDWLASEPTQEQMQEVFKELSAKDKGAAKPLREKLDEIKRASQQDAVAHEWAEKGDALLQAARLNIADALAWQRDAARAGAPLSREPLASLRASLAERVKAVEDTQQRLLVQREAAVLLAQRIELLSTKPWADAEAQHAGLEADVAHWRTQATALQADPHWASVDMRYPPQLEAAQTQLAAVWDAFTAALAQTRAAAQDAAAPLPPVPVWADELRAARGEPVAEPEKPAKPKVDPEQRAAAQKAVEAGTMLLEQAVASGHTKNMHSATNALRQSLKTHGRLIDDALEARVHAALVSAGELEGWQRWSADKVRQELVARAEALLVKRRKQPSEATGEAAAESAAATESEAAAAGGEPAGGSKDAETPAAEAAPEAPAPAAEPAPAEAGETAESAEATAPQTEDTAAAEPLAAPAVARPALADDEEWAPAMGGRKLQETIRKLRDEWKTADQGGAPNHALWKRFDRALNTAHKFVDEWLGKVRAEAAEHRAHREALIAEVEAFAAAHAQAGDGTDWKALNRQVRQFSERWRAAGHISEKLFGELQPRWKAAIHAAALPLESAQKASTERRRALIAEAEQLGAAPQLRVDAVKDLQARWQAEAQAVPLDRKHEQKLWDAFRKPIDDAFNRKGAEREQQRAAMSAHDKAVLDAAKALEAANASGDAQQIRAAMAALEAATRGQAAAAQAAADSKENQAPALAQEAQAATESGASEAPAELAAGTAGEAAEPTEAAPAAEGEGAAAAEPAAAAPAPAAPKRVVAVRGDDRPGLKKDAPAGPAGRGGRPGDRRDARGGPGGDRRGAPGGPGRGGDRGDRGGRFGDRPGGDRSGDRFGRDDRAPRGPRLGDAAFRAQRDAVEHAQAALKKLAAQAHGETLTQLMGAWAERQPEQVPSAQELGRAVTGGVRGTWTQALGTAPKGDAGEALLRLEMAAEVPTPADQLDARRALQLQLLTRRNEAGPRETWTDDAAKVLASPHSDAAARRLQSALKVLMRK
ncbi:MAG: DUF349 domain-containing protein [Burkholderiaceae bacterium]|uniref:DUF349 domain-containing protein n=1 Tax=Ottowia sp. TaxID=1898956 RepID=UPI001D7B2A27|nr:DUF349 domain-containing protein [Ottowia sp.]MCB2025372.1 DUF349 domain-containing protein [Ottowia sp.]MCP5258177.1 DUF349 domain-containing protein [Burkholderiaceae bacterium]HRW71342.1 DUF349 domain-containing protein [Ottowia sp.]